VNTDTHDPLRMIESGLDKLGHSPGAIDGLWGLRTARAMKALLAANGRAASVTPPGPLPGSPRPNPPSDGMRPATGPS